ncbi:LysR family transcriptional regulator [Thiomonas sp. FB-Cd]|uniref:LysR family transcriptional regulator n=1 Tax=Thiomonas sp. FB-Cd TaxID=1158292 RepID=UPI000A7CC9F7|nr:LysR substrate-binding domain-containing protein [Thiomonas sp. FB-Cd]
MTLTFPSNAASRHSMLARKYRYLLALAQSRHFGRAAASCHVSPSTLSAAVRDLESELGVAIVERGRTFSGFTAEGLSVVDYARRMSAVEADFRLHLSKMGGGLSGRLSLGVIPTALTVVAGLSVALAQRHPQLRLEILSLNTGAILRGVQAFELDGGIVYTESSNVEGLDFMPLWQERHVLIAGQRIAASLRDTMSWSEAGQLPLCLLTPDMQNRKTIDRVFDALGARPQPSLETNSIVSMLAHVGSGPWCAILPGSVLDVVGTPKGVKVVRLVEPTVTWETGLITVAREPRPVGVEALLAAARTTRER